MSRDADAIASTGNAHDSGSAATDGDRIAIRVDGRTLHVPSDVTVAAALLNAGIAAFRRSVHGAPRGPLCGMGICFECRVTIDGLPHRRACLESVQPGMEVTTGV